MEIERKWKLYTLPQAEPYAVYSVLQKYLTSGDIEVRVRKAQKLRGDEGTNLGPYVLTIKGPGSLSREEINFEIEEDKFNTIYNLIKEPPIFKDYYLYSYGDYCIEVNVVDQQFIYAEVEFNSEEEANAFVWPWPEVKPIEVTNDSSYKMKNYWNKERMNRS